jgi:hypothetical protein
LQEKRLIIYLDEIMFTNKNIVDMEYSNKFQNISVDYKKLNYSATAVVAAITMELGLLTWKPYGKSVDIPKFIDFLNHLKTVSKGRKMTVFMDNLSVHRSKTVIKFM